MTDKRNENRDDLKEKAESARHQVTGRVKEAVGALTDDEKLKKEGQAEKKVGEAAEKIQEAREES